MAHVLAAILMAVTPSPSPGPGGGGGGSGSTTTPWVPIATFAAALVAALAALVGAYLQRKTGREAGAAAARAAAAAERSAGAAERNAQAAEVARAEAQRDAAADAFTGLIQSLLTPPPFPSPDEPITRLVEYGQQLRRWMDTTNIAVANTWKFYVHLPASDVVARSRRQLTGLTNRLTQTINQITVRSHAGESSDADSIRSLSETNPELFNELAVAVNQLQRLATETMREIRASLWGIDRSSRAPRSESYDSDSDDYADSYDYSTGDDTH